MESKDVNDSYLFQCSHPVIYTEAVRVLTDGGRLSDETFAVLKGPVELKGKKQEIVSRPFNMYEKVVIRALFKELNIVIGLIRLLADCVKNGHELEPAYDEYIKRIESIKAYHVEHKPVGSSKDDYKVFIKYFVECALFIKETFGYTEPVKDENGKEIGKDPFKQILTDFNNGADVKLRFDKESRKDLEDIIKTGIVNDEGYGKIAEKFEKSFKAKNDVKQTNSYKVDVYSKMSKVLKLPMIKPFKIGVGVAIFKKLLDEIHLVKARNECKKDIVIYLKL